MVVVVCSLFMVLWVTVEKGVFDGAHISLLKYSAQTADKTNFRNGGRKSADRQVSVYISYPGDMLVNAPRIRSRPRMLACAPALALAFALALACALLQDYILRSN